MKARNEYRGNRKAGADLLVRLSCVHSNHSNLQRYGETKQRAILEGIGRVKGFSKKDKKMDRWLLLSARHIFYYKSKDGVYIFFVLLLFSFHSSYLGASSVF
jgi:hypothetical protein